MNNDQEIQISVICTAFNHEKYIRKCLDGFVMQKVNFRFEVIVHDDASTDKTAEIIKEYEIKYPDIIVPIYQTENQYSQGVKIIKSFIFPKIRGKYIANCEGDDYWTDPDKLQKQYDYMEAHPECSMCVHRAVRHFLDGREDCVFPPVARVYPLGEIIEVGGAVFATNSALRRAELVFNRPQCFNAKGFGDYQMFMYAAICGTVVCLEDVMSVYNCGTAGSWTERIWKNPEKKLEHCREEIRMLKAVDQYYDGKYRKHIDKRVSNIENTICAIYEEQNDRQMLSEEPFRTIHKKRKRMKRRTQLVSYIDKHLPWIRKLWKKMKANNHN